MRTQQQQNGEFNFLKEFELEIRHIPGKENKIADELSYRYEENDGTTDEKRIAEQEYEEECQEDEEQYEEEIQENEEQYEDGYLEDIREEDEDEYLENEQEENEQDEQTYQKIDEELESDEFIQDLLEDIEEMNDMDIDSRQEEQMESRERQIVLKNNHKNNEVVKHNGTRRNNKPIQITMKREIRTDGEKAYTLERDTKTYRGKKEKEIYESRDKFDLQLVRRH